MIDTKGDVAAVVGRLEDAANQKVDAIVINVDPSQVAAGLEAAKAANIPVFGMDAGANATARHQCHQQRLFHGGGHRRPMW